MLLLADSVMLHSSYVCFSVSPFGRSYQAFISQFHLPSACIILPPAESSGNDVLWYCEVCKLSGLIHGSQSSVLFRTFQDVGGYQRLERVLVSLMACAISPPLFLPTSSGKSEIPGAQGNLSGEVNISFSFLQTPRHLTSDCLGR